MLELIGTPVPAMIAAVVFIIIPVVTFLCYSTLRDVPKQTEALAFMASVMVLIFYLGLFVGLTLQDVNNSLALFELPRLSGF